MHQIFKTKVQWCLKLESDSKRKSSCSRTFGKSWGMILEMCYDYGNVMLKDCWKDSANLKLKVIRLYGNTYMFLSL